MLKFVVLLLQAQRQVQQEASCADQAAADISSLIPEYRSTLARMKRQVDELHFKLEDAHQQRDSLQQQVITQLPCVLAFAYLHDNTSSSCIEQS